MTVSLNTSMIVTAQFSDILLVAAMTAYGRYKVRHKLSLSNILVIFFIMQCESILCNDFGRQITLQVSVVQSPVLKNSFCVAEKGMTRPFRFCTK